MNWSVSDRSTEVTKVEGESSEESADLWFGAGVTAISRSKPSETSITASGESSEEFNIDLDSLNNRGARLKSTTELTESGEASDKDSFVASQLDLS